MNLDEGMNLDWAIVDGEVRCEIGYVECRDG